MARLPDGSREYRYRGRNYYHHRHHWYRPYWRGGRVYYWPAYPPLGYYYRSLPDNYTVIVVDGNDYYYSDGTYYTDGEQEGQAGYVVAEAPETTEPPTDVTDAEQAGEDPFAKLKEMNEYVGQMEEFIVYVSSKSEEVLDSGEKIELSERRTVYVRRPNRISVELRSDEENRRVLYDGKSLTLLDRKRKMYGTAEMPDTIEKTVDKLAKEYGIILPLGELLSEDMYSEQIGRIRSGEYVGRHSVAGYSCHHLAFTQDAIDWEIWIEDGDKPLPRKLVITYKLQPGSPRYSMKMTRWEITKLPSYAFDLTIPSDAQRIEILREVEAEGGELPQSGS